MSHVSRKVEQAFEEKRYVRDDFEYLDKRDIIIDFKLPIDKIVLLLENYNSCIYECIIDNEVFIIKQSKVNDDVNLLREYKNLRHYTELKLDGFLFPKVYGYSSRKRYYIMQKISGNNVFMESINLKDGEKMFGILGFYLAEFHIKSSDAHLKSITKENILEDIFMAYDSYPFENIVMEFYKQHCQSKSYLVGFAYEDFDPLNILFEQGKIYLIDPPDNKVNSFLLWDISTFLVGFKKEMIKKNPLYLIFNLYEENLNMFLESYFSHINDFYNTEIGYIDTLLFQLQRIEVLLVYQSFNDKTNIIGKAKKVISILVLKMFRNSLLKEMEMYIE